MFSHYNRIDVLKLRLLEEPGAETFVVPHLVWLCLDKYWIVNDHCIYTSFWWTSSVITVQFLWSCYITYAYVYKVIKLLKLNYLVNTSCFGFQRGEAGIRNAQKNLSRGLRVWVNEFHGAVSRGIKIRSPAHLYEQLSEHDVFVNSWSWKRSLF